MTVFMGILKIIIFFAVFCDPSKAFDCFSHDKLNYHDITGIAPQPCKFVFKQNSTVSITVKM